MPASEDALIRMLQAAIEMEQDPKGLRSKRPGPDITSMLLDQLGGNEDAERIHSIFQNATKQRPGMGPNQHAAMSANEFIRMFVLRELIKRRLGEILSMERGRTPTE